MINEKSKPMERPTSVPRRLFWTWILLVLVLSALASTEIVYAQNYRGRFLPGVTIGSIPVGGLTEAEAKKRLQNATDRILADGLTFTIQNTTRTVASVIIAPDDPDLVRELVQFDRDTALAEAFSIGRGPNIIKNVYEQIVARTHGRAVLVPVTVNRPELEAAVNTQFAHILLSATDARFSIKLPDDTTGGNEAIDVTVIPESVGVTIDRAKLFAETRAALMRLEPPRIEAVPIPDLPNITRDEIEPFRETVLALLVDTPWTLRFERSFWTIDAEAKSRMLTIAETNDAPHLVLRGPELDALLASIAQAINRSARDAKFAIENGKVLEFQGSASGVQFDDAGTRVRMEEAFLQGEDEIEVVAALVEPNITTAEVNDLGIEGVLGVGTSNFARSPANRIKNIQNASRLLHGTLVKPGEEFSLIAATHPYTLENGYLPEMVIKGDKITPEIGGGLCQIGTTMFRAAMNSGTPITARRNHSLVVSYYNDPQNGNPGTDATIYEPGTDLKFLNDTGAHILVTTEVDLETMELRYTLWGKLDGRKGYYSPPVVDRWIPAGSPMTIETTDLAPGTKKCQSRFNGADTHFTYTIERPDGTVEEEEFVSHYRSLPAICLVGVEALPEEPPNEGAENLPPAEAADLTTP